jgi:hypothetical protein
MININYLLCIALDSKSSSAGSAGSIPARGTIGLYSYETILSLRPSKSLVAIIDDDIASCSHLNNRRLSNESEGSASSGAPIKIQNL